MNRWNFLIIMIATTPGCTMLSLERHTLHQSTSAGDIRYQELMGNLAMVARDRSALPAYSTIFYGTISVGDSGQIGSTTTWQHVIGAGAQNGFSSEALNPQLSRTVLQNWSLDPILGPERIEAIRALLRWSIYGRETLTANELSLLASPDQNPSPGRHFGVLQQLEQLPPHWVHCGRFADKPHCTAYEAHSGDTWVWVLPEDSEALSHLLLAVQNIARVNGNSLVLFAIPTTPSSFSFPTLAKTVPADKPAFSVTATVAVSPGLKLVPMAIISRGGSTTSAPIRRSAVKSTQPDCYLEDSAGLGGDQW
jgi:hypothetical protein